MPRTRVISSNFTAGELSQRIYGRIDLAKYYNGADAMLNFYSYVQGGATRRPGTVFIRQAMGPGGRLIPFKFNAANSYVLELGDQAIRFYHNKQIISLTSPPWNYGLGSQTADGALTWTNGVGFPKWTPNTVWSPWVSRIIDANGNVQQCTATFSGGGVPIGIPAQGGSTVPKWNLTVGGTTTDGEVIWTNRGVPLWQPNTVYAANSVLYTDAGLMLLTAGAGGSSGAGAANATPLRIPTPWLLADVGALKFAQNGDVLYFAHQSYPPFKLERLAETNWQLLKVNFQPPPTYEPDFDIGTPLNASLTPGAVTGTGITFTSNAAGTFLAGDVNRVIVTNSGASLATITAVTDAQHVVADIIDDFPSTAPIPAGSWFLRGAPWAYMNQTPNANPVNSEGGTTKFNTLTKTAGVAQPAFRPQDVGNYLKIEGGEVQISTVPDSSDITARVLSQLSPTFLTSSVDGSKNTIPVDAGLWTMEVPAWDPVRGYPGAVTFHEDRLMFGGTPTQPNTWWGSQSGDYENFAVSSADDGALDFTLNDGLFDGILWMNSGRDLMLGTVETEHRANAGLQNTAIASSKIDVKRQSAYGSAAIQPLQIVNSILFVQRQGTKLYEHTYSFYIDQYAGTNLNILADHVTASGIKEMAYAQEPDSVIWMVRNDGNLIGLTYDKNNEVTAWHRHTSPDPNAGAGATAFFQSVCTIPDPPSLSDQVWLLTARTNMVAGNPVTNYFVELMDPTCELDCAYRYAGPATNVVTLPGEATIALQGQSAQAVANGAAYPAQTIFGNGQYAFPLGVTVTAADIGLFAAGTLTTVRPDLQQVIGTVQGLKKKWTRVYARLLNAAGGIQINGQPVPVRVPANPMDAGIPVQTFDMKVTNLGYDRDGRIVITRSAPQPVTILAIFGVLDIADSD